MSGPGAMEDVIHEQSELYSASERGWTMVSKNQKVMVYGYLTKWRWSRLMWNSRSQKIGLAMTPGEMSSLHDIKSHNDDTETEHTFYILQFLWRDLTSSFDIIGPYFPSSETFKAKHIIGYVWDHKDIWTLWIPYIGSSLMELDQTLQQLNVWHQ